MRRRGGSWRRDRWGEGLAVYTSLAEVPPPVDLVSVYLPAAVGLQVLPAIKKLAPEQVFFNPGADTPEVIAAAERLGLNPVRTCSIIYLGYSPGMFPG
jgi:predicted CoA-binding protein